MTTSEPGLPRTRRGDETAFWLVAGHLWSVFAIALSNLFLGLGILASGRRFWATLTAREHRVAMAPLGLYALVLVVAAGASVDPLVSLPSLRELFSLATLPLGLLLVRGRRRALLVCDGLAVVAVASSVWGLLQLLAADGALTRVRGPFSHYMTLAGFLVLVDLVVMARLACDPAARRTWWRWALLVPINLAVVATLTRGAWVALFLGFTLLLLVRARHLLGVFFTVVVVFVLVAPQPVRHRAISTFNPRDPTNYDRLCMLDAGARMVAHHPLTGVGQAMVPQLYPIYRHPTAVRRSVKHLHSTLVQLAAERGLAALVAYLWLMVGAVVAALRHYQTLPSRDGPLPGLYLGVVVALLAFNIGGLFEDNWSDTEVQRVTLFLIALPHALGAGAAAARERIPPVGQPGEPATG
ncbi:MAG: O-antigen ligase family protein [Thermoanaerobaculia bacterium]|nr:O-antigen ligase family protein [Thermoanaerobaculia bacterium]